MDETATRERQEARQPLTSLLRKSEKAHQKLTPGTWQHSSLGDTIIALRMALVLMDRTPCRNREFSKTDLEEALRSLASVMARASKAQQKFSPGTSQHTLQRNRIRALQVAEGLLNAERLHLDTATEASME